MCSWIYACNYVMSFLTAVLVYLSTVHHQLILLEREIEGYKKSTSEEQEQNETLTMQLNWSQMDCATSKKLISQKLLQQEALQTHYSACLRTLRETERTHARLSKVARGHSSREVCSSSDFLPTLSIHNHPSLLGNQYPPD